jgi:hypothetical protein
MTTMQLRNCEFAFKCDAKWDDLDVTGEDKIRFCNECEKQVHRCDTDDELVGAIKSNLCVAIQAPYSPQQQEPRRMLLGSLRVRTSSPSTGDGE